MSKVWFEVTANHKTTMYLWRSDPRFIITNSQWSESVTTSLI